MKPARPPKFTSLWKGPNLHDHVESAAPGGGTPFSCTLSSTGLFAIDPKGVAWTLCNRLCTGVYRWFRVEELLSGAAARLVLAEEAGAARK